MCSKAKQQALMNKYRDYYGEGWSLVDCRAMTWPFYKLEVSFRFSQDEPLPLVEEYVLKAVHTGYIQTVESLGLFLGLDSSIVDSVLADLHQKEVVSLEPCLSLTSKGQLLLEKQNRRVVKEDKKKIYMDGVSGECRIQDVRNSKNKKATVKPAIVYPRNETLEHHYRTLYEFISSELGKKDSKKNEGATKEKKSVQLDEITSLTGHFQRLYEDRLVLFYKSEVSDDGRYLVLTDDEMDVAATESLEEHIKEGKSGFDIKGDENKVSKYRDSTGKEQRKIKTWSDIEQCPETTVIEMLDHPVVLKLALQTASHRIIINSPWIRDDVVDEEFKQGLREALQRGVEVLIIYGMQTERQQRNKKPDISSKAKLFFESLKKNKRYNFSLVKQEGNHAKVLICDDYFMVVSSYNWLSFPGAKTEQVRVETGTLIKNPNEIREKTASFIRF